ncbi:MAG: hypothetical protein WCJ71_05795 [Candidatus Omnitrophota bacterium]
MTDNEIRKYLLFTKKNGVPKNDALRRLATVHKLNIEEYKQAVVIAKTVYG